MKFTYKHLLKNRIFLTLFLATSIFCIIYLFHSYFYGINDDLKKFSIKFKNQTYLSDTKKQSINKDLVFITIDEKTIDKLGFPLPRGEYVPVLDYLDLADAEIIGFDIIFANYGTLDQDGDKKFEQAINRAGNVVLGGAIIPDDINGAKIELPLASFYKSAYNFGYYQPIVDQKTERVTSFYPELELHDTNGEKGKFDHFSIAVLRAYYSKVYQKDIRSFSGVEGENFQLKPGYIVPYSQKDAKNININFLPKPNAQLSKVSLYPHYSFLDVYENKINPKVFEGKIVLIGATAKGLKDTFTTPNGIEYGVFVLGNIINTILTKNYLINFNENHEWLLIYFLLLLSVYFNLSRSGYVLIFSNIALSIIFLVIFPIFILLYSSFLLGHIFELFLALILSLALGNMTKYLIENKNKLKLSKALSEYVSRAIAEEILTSSGDVNLDGETKNLAIFFSDIEGFTSISEDFSPETLVSFLREYLTEMSTILLDTNGFINKYEGDAIMALWGTFNEKGDKKILACEAAIAQQKKLVELNKTWRNQGFPEIKARIGLHFGDAIVGNIGAKGRKMEYTALGDNVNLASRLEGVNKFYGTYICASEDIYKDTKDYFHYRFLDEIRVKGKTEAIKIYELIDRIDAVTQEQIKMSLCFESAYALYANGKIKEAKKIFEELRVAGDIPSSTYIRRCNEFLELGLPKDWKGIWSFDSK